MLDIEQTCLLDQITFNEEEVSDLNVFRSTLQHYADMETNPYSKEWLSNLINNISEKDFNNYMKKRRLGISSGLVGK